MSSQQIVLSDASVIKILEVKRLLPNRRIVCRGIWNEQAVYAKVFVGTHAKKYASRDRQGIQQLIDASICTPKILCFSEVRKIQEVHVEPFYIMVLEEIAGTENAEVLWNGLAFSSVQRLQVAEKLVLEVAKHHNADLLQTDLYLKNFLVKDDAVYTLDGDGIRHSYKLSQQQALKNLNILLSKINVLELERWLPSLVKKYWQARNWQTEPDTESLKKMVNLYRKEVASEYADKKVFRTCTDVKIKKQKSCFVAISNQFSLKNLPTAPQDCDALINTQQRLKSGHTCTVAMANIDGVNVVVKRYNIKSVMHAINRALRQTRAATSWSNAHRLVILGIATAAPVALIETHKFGFRGRAYYLSEYVDAPDISDFFSAEQIESVSAEAVTNIANLFYQLFLLDISHGDMKASNIKVQDNKPVLIDLDSMQQHRSASVALNAHVRDLQRFMQNWQESPALYNAFVDAFKLVYVDYDPLRLAHIIK